MSSHPFLRILRGECTDAGNNITDDASSCSPHCPPHCTPCFSPCLCSHGVNGVIALGCIAALTLPSAAASPSLIGVSQRVLRLLLPLDPGIASLAVPWLTPRLMQQPQQLQQIPQLQQSLQSPPVEPVGTAGTVGTVGTVERGKRGDEVETVDVLDLLLQTAGSSLPLSLVTAAHPSNPSTSQHERQRGGQQQSRPGLTAPTASRAGCVDLLRWLLDEGMFIK